ncbi:MAG: GDSL-type esterase/lipase family protein, partial [Phycisphaerales bacterium]|nr:GDSL-type esterase/lipase family protein [Phycisphaerales bacterium]
MKYIASFWIMLASLLLVSCGNHEEHGQAEHSAPMGHGHGEKYEAPTGPLVPDKGDHVVIVGNTFAERMAHFGHFETLLHDAYPDHELVVRNLGWSGDTPSLQPRPLDFGTMEEYLVQEQADIIIACFGMNESFAGEAGRADFEESLREFIASMRDLKPGGALPDILLVSPIAHESLGGNFPDGADHNVDLAAYTESMRMVAQEQGVRFVDLHAPSSELWNIPIGPRSFTINGIHLNEQGNQLISAHLFHMVFNPDAPDPDSKLEEIDWQRLASLRAAVVEKNRQFFYRYRPINSYYVMGGRKNPFGVVNFPAEMAKLDAMVAHRDDRVHAIAAGRDPGPINDDDTGAFTDIESNYAGPDIVFRDPADTKAGFDVPEGYALECFASEQDFPELANPVALTFDERGRLWVLVIPTYPQYLPGVAPEDKLLVLEDTDGDGRADTCDVFADGLHVPTGFELGDGGVYVAAQPNLLFLQDTDGDGKADTSEVVLHGFGTEDSHHALSAFEWGPGGGLYFQEGTFHHSQVETPHGPVRVKNGAVFRYEPRTGKVRVHVSYGFANPWGHVFDDWGQDYVADASGGANYLGANIASKMSYERKHRGVPSFEDKSIRPTGGCEIVSSEHLGADLQGDYLLTNVITLRGIRQHELSDVGSGIKGTHQQDLLVSDDPLFRPCDIQVGPDGALWFVDWYNPLIGHMQHSLRDPNRDHAHGRVWRLVRSDAPLSEVVDVSEMSTVELFAVLEHPERRTRDRARLALRNKPTDEVIAAGAAWAAEADATEHDQLEALWVLQNHDVVDVEHLRRVLSSPEPRARAAGVRVLSAWADRVPDAVALLHVAANDPAPRVRLEAVVAASWLDNLDGAEIALEAATHPRDRALDHVLEQTMIELSPHWTKAMRGGWSYAEANPSAIDDLLLGVSTQELMRMQALPAVERALLRRSDAPVDRRLAALEAVAAQKNVPLAAAWLDELNRDDARTAGDSSEPGKM